MSNIEEYTKNFKFMIPEFNVATWHDEIKENFKAIDALIANFVQAQQYQGAWKKVTQYYVNDLVYISDEDSTNYGGLYRVLVNHITTGDNFDTFLANHPTYYNLQGEMGAQNAAQCAQDWASKTNGKVVVNGSAIDYSAKAYAVGGTGTTTNNAKYYKQQAEAARNSILNDAGFIAIKNDFLGDENIKTVADNIQSVDSIGDNISSILSVYNNLSGINTCSSNINAILNAPTQAANAQHSAELAAQYANDKINQTHITNCITEIPQDINLELSSGTLTLKSGSKVYVPNGAGVFNSVTTTTDLTTTRTGSGECIVWYNNNNNTIQTFPSNLVYSGSSAPSGQTYMYWYDTANNKCKVTSNGGSTWTEDKSFPLAILGLDGTQISEIKQVFNGFGFVGTVLFVLPNVKVLIPNGRNADGTQKSTLRTLSSVITRDDLGASRTGYSVAINSGLFINYSSNGYVLKEDGFLYTGSGVQRSDCVVGIYSTDANKKITSFVPRITFLITDYNDFKQADDQNVKLTGNQSYSGIKTATTVNGIQATVSGSNNILQKNTSASILESSRQSDSVNGYSVWDRDSRVAGMFGTIFRTDGGTQSFMRAVGWSSTTQSPAPANISITVDNSGNVKTSAPTPDSTDNSSQIATTSMLQSWANTNNANCLSTWSKGGNGYFKFKNGLIVQWGTITSGSSNSFNTVTLPTAFSSGSSYSVTATGRSGSAALSDYNTVINSSNKTATSFQVSWDDNDSGAYWLAIGY